MTSIISFPREHRPHVEVFRVTDRTDGRRMFVFELVGRDEDGPFRIDVAHRYTLNEVAEDVALWWKEGIEVHGVGVFA